MISMRAVLSLALLILALPALALDPSALHLASGTYGAADLSRMAPPTTDDGLWALHFTGRIGASEREALESAGLEILGYLPVNGLLVRGDDPARATSLATVDFAHPYRPEWRRDGSLQGRGGEMMDLRLELLPGEDPARFAGRAAARGAQVIRVIENAESPRVYLRASSNRIEDLAALPGLRWMSEPGEINERLAYVRWITQSALPDSMPMWDAGLNGQGQILGHIDSGMQLETCHFHDPDGYPVGPDHRKVVYMDPSIPFSSHGLHTASIMAGDIEPLYGWDTNRGLAYRARFATSRYRSNDPEWDLYETFVTHHDHGARVHTNSWGQDAYTHYTQYCRDIDLFSYEFEYSMVAFAVTNQSVLKSPENAKNVLAVGATRNATEDDLTLFELHGYGGIGPTWDGRRKPEIYAPGRSVWAAAEADPVDPEDWQNYCRGRGAGGTSMACPTIVAAGGLLRQYFTEGWYPEGAPNAEDAFTPTGALLRASLINMTHDLAGVDGYPSDLEGWGRIQMNLGLKVDPASPIDLYLQDFPHAQGLDTGQERVYNFAVDGDSLDLKITLAFTDYPAEVSATEAPINDLDLLLSSPTGQTYHGNHFLDGYSVPGGAADAINCIERVNVENPITGTWTLRVLGSNVPMGPQGFAFIVSGQLADADLVPPELDLELRVAEGALNLLLSSSELLDEDLVSMTLNDGDSGITLNVTAVTGSEGLQYEATYVPELMAELAVQACASDLSGNQTCVFDEIGVYPLVAGQSAYLQFDDGRFGLDLPPGGLADPTLILIRQMDTEPYLGHYEIQPAISLLEPAAFEWDYSEVDFADGQGPENLEVLVGERGLVESFFDADAQKLIAVLEDLNSIGVSLGTAGSSDALDATFAQLGEAFPNPYRPLSHGDIRFALELRDTQRLKISIFDVSGRRMATIFDDLVLPGTREIAWDGRDGEGSELASGIYFLRLEAAGEVMTRKLVMVR